MSQLYKSVLICVSATRKRIPSHIFSSWKIHPLVLGTDNEVTDDEVIQLSSSLSDLAITTGSKYWGYLWFDITCLQKHSHFEGKRSQPTRAKVGCSNTMPSIETVLSSPESAIIPYKKLRRSKS